MGYETSLRIDGKTLLQWRKYAGAEPRMLFRYTDVNVRTGKPFDSEDEESAILVQYESTVARVLETLSDNGLGWSATVAGYSEIRQDVVASSILHVDHMLQDGEFVELSEYEGEYDANLKAFQQTAPSTDLDILGRIMAHQFDAGAAEVVIFDDISLGGRIDSTTRIPFGLREYARRIGLDPYPAIRAAESWIVLNQEAPLLAWPMLVCTLLHQLPPEGKVTFDLTEDARANDVHTIAEGREYADNFWSETSANLSSVARTMGRLFSVLASFDSKLGHEYWFAQASALHDRIVALNGAGSQVSTKTRGDALEMLVEAIFNTEPGLEVVERNVRSSEEEIDVLATNGIDSPFWQAMASPLILVECKNTTKPIGVPPLRILESKMQDRGSICRVGVFVSMSGFTKTFTARLQRFPSDSGIIFAVSGEELKALIDTKTRLSDWLRGPGIKRSIGGSS